jgi:hypothetical protein
MYTFVKVYKARIDHTPSKLELGKVDAVRWFTKEEAKRLATEHPDTVTDGLRYVLTKFY